MIRATAVSALATVLLGSAPEPAAAGVAGAGSWAGTRAVVYAGYTFLVPRSWPVIRTTDQAGGCVRFDQHAIYLGQVSPDQLCPSWLLGTTEAVLVQPGPVRASAVATEDVVAREVVVTAPRISITATFDTQPGVIYRILAGAKLPVPVVKASAPPATTGSAGAAGAAPTAGAVAAAGSPGSNANGGGASGSSGIPPEALATAAMLESELAKSPTFVSLPPLPGTVTNFHGLGFDACSAPSAAYMRTWLRLSPYRAVGIYIGGSDRACAQANLTPTWVRSQAEAGWRFVPLYAGPQAAFGELDHPRRQGTAAAMDAVAQASRLGFGLGAPIYYDMEAYLPRARRAALAFERAWTAEIHRLGYISGIYSSSDSGVVDLAGQYSRHRAAAPDIIFDALWNGRATAFDHNLRPNQWPDHHRIHQYAGNITQRFGRDKINIDKDFLNVLVAVPGGTPQASSAVTLPRGRVEVFYRGRNGTMWYARFRPGRGWSAPHNTYARIAGMPSAVWAGGRIEVFYLGAHGELVADIRRLNGQLLARRGLPQMGILGSAPRAVSQAGGVIDVFWHGSADGHLWHAQFTPSSGWRGPQDLGGALGSGPSPVITTPGVCEVFWKGTDNNLWLVRRGMVGHWSAPVSLGMGPLGSSPQATAQANGAIEVFWRGALDPHVWEAFFRPFTGWHGARDLGGMARGSAWPVSADGTVLVLWRSRANRMFVIAHRPGSGWWAGGWSRTRLRVGSIGSDPFAASGSGGQVPHVFWYGRKESFWSAFLASQGWTGPVRISR